ncbi:MAG: glycosyltransferase family 4 protein [Acidimicrobiia bacterium]|nr:glycosyltransferase family 4 protein [Acidimicrobiia bacterium]
MHICFIEDTHLHGGTQIWVAEAMREFMGKGHEVTLLTAAGGFNARDGATTDARVVTYDFDDVTSEDAKHRRIWTEALSGADVAVCTVHPPRAGFHCSVFAARCIEEAGLETLLEPKTGTIVPEYKREFYLPQRDIRSHVITITDFTRRYLIETLGIPEGGVSLVYQGTEVSRFTPDDARRRVAETRYPLPRDAAPILGNVGSFEHRKGQVVLLEAVAEMRRTLPNVHLMLVGDGPDEELLRAKVGEIGLEGNVTFFPFTREPVHVFEVIDILVLSSLYKEGLPNVLLEAMSMGLPVVASRLAGIPEVVFDGRTGWLTEPGDVDGLARAVERLWADPTTCRQMGSAGRDLMEREFDKLQQFDAFLDHFAVQVARA